MTDSRSDPPQGAADKPLSASVLKGGSWLGLSAVAQAVLQIVIFAILARLLTPAQFRLVAIASIFIDLATGIAPLGTGQALIQRRDLTDDHIRAAVWISIATGLLTSVILIAAAGPIASLLGSAESMPLIMALAAMFPIRALSFVPAGLAARAKNFRALAIRQIVAYVLGFGVVGIASAFYGAGPWALVYAQLTQATIATVLLVAMVRFPVRPSFSWVSYKEILSFGTGFSAAVVINSLATQADRMIVAANTTIASLGVYTRSLQLVRYPSLLIGQVIEDVLFPSFSGVQDDIPRLRNGFLRSVGAVSVVMFPVTAFLWSAAEPIVDVLLGSGWREAAPLVVIFGMALPFRSSQRICSAILRSMGQSWLVAALQVFLLVATVIGSTIGVQYGINGAATGATLAFFAHYVALLIFCCARLGIPATTMLRHHVAGVVLAVLVGLVAVAVVALLHGASGFLILPAAVICTGIVVAVATWLLPKLVLQEDGKWLVSLLAGKLPMRVRKVRPLAAYLRRITQ